MSDAPDTPNDVTYEFLGKPRLPRGLSHPLKRSLLDEFLRNEGLVTVTGVLFCGASKEDSNRVLSASYYGGRGSYGVKTRHALHLSFYPVASKLRSVVERLIVSTVFPDLAKWIRSFDDASLLRAQMNHSLCYVLERDAEQAATDDEGAGLRLVPRFDVRPRR
jgi:hypothetical protein